MEKHQVISFIESQIRAGAITKEDLYAVAGGKASTEFAADASRPPSPAVTVTSTADSSRNLINVFYAIGAIIALIGVVILVQQHWEEIGTWGRLLVSLGIALVTYLAALLLGKPSMRVISQVFFTISAALFPLGIYVLVSEQGMESSAAYQLWSGLGLLVVFLVAWLISKRNILVLLSVAFASWAFYAGIYEYLSSAYIDDLFTWATFVAGVAFILVGYWFRSVVMATDTPDEHEKRAVGGILYAFGTLGALGAGITLGGVYDLAFIVLVFAAFYLSVFLKSRSMLILAALFLIGHIVKLTSEYFADSIGWPLSLVVIGFLVIGIGAATYHINKRFIRAA